MNLKQNRPVLIALSMGNFTVGIGVMIIAGLIEPMASEFNVSLSMIGQLLAIYAISYAIASPVLTSLTSTIELRKVLAAALILLIIGNTLCGIAFNYEVEVIGRIIVAIGAAIYTPGASAAAAVLVLPQERSKAIAFVFIGMTAASALGFPFSTFVGLQFHWRLAFFMVAAFACIAACVLWHRFPAGLKLPTSGFTAIYRALKNPVLLAFFAITALQLAAQLVIFTFVTPMLRQYIGATALMVAMFLVLNGLSSVVGNIAAGHFSSRFGPRRTMLGLAVLLLVTVSAFPLMDGSPLAATLIIIALGFVSFSFQVPQQTRLVSYEPSHYNAVLSLNAAALYLGTAAGAFAGSFYVESVGLDGLNWLAGSIALLCLALLVFTWNWDCSQKARLNQAPDNGL